MKKEKPKPEEPKEPVLDQKVFRAILQKGIDFKITKAHPNVMERIGYKMKKPKLFGGGFLINKEKVITFFPMYAGTMMTFSDVYCEINKEDAETLSIDNEKTNLDRVMRFVNKHGDKILKMIAIAIENNGGEPSKKLIKYLRENATNSELFTLWMPVVAQVDVSSFLALTTLIQGTVLSEVIPTIGESMEDLSNTSDLQEKKSSGDGHGKT